MPQAVGTKIISMKDKSNVERMLLDLILGIAPVDDIAPWAEIKNNAWVTVNNDFWVTSEAICQ